MNTTTERIESAGTDCLRDVSWSAGAALLCWLALLHACVVSAFAAGVGVSPLVAPVVTLAALAAAWWFARTAGLTGWHVVAPPLLTAVVIAAGALIATAFFDLTWDGQWYHQTAVYKMAAGWNPLRDPLTDFGRHTWNLWVWHYAKGPWYLALAIYAATGNIETAKAASVIAPFVTVLVVRAAALELGVARRWTLVVAVLVAFNPVTTCGMLTHQVDGILVSLMACAVAAGICWVRKPRAVLALVVFLATALCVNVKFTGLVYACFFALAGGLYCLWRRRDLVIRYGVVTGLALVVGVVVLGYNPYVTNTIYRGHPFFPVQGTAAHPGLADQGKDPIELYETPRNMMGRSRFLRLAYGVFGKPGTAPYGSPNAAFMWPFAVAAEDFPLYYFHDVRIGGFGPLFSGALLLALGLAVAGLARREMPASAVLFVSAAIVASLLVSTHTWWARYGPHLWWLPIVIAAAGMAAGAPTWLKRASAVVLLLLLVDAAILGAVHLRWEVRSTDALHRQLTDLRDAGPMTVNLGYFDVPVAERFRTFGIPFESASGRRYQCTPDRQVTLMSVCRGYPEWINICLADPARAAQLKAKPYWQWSAQP